MTLALEQRLSLQVAVAAARLALYRSQGLEPFHVLFILVWPAGVLHTRLGPSGGIWVLRRLQCPWRKKCRVADCVCPSLLAREGLI